MQTSWWQRYGLSFRLAVTNLCASIATIVLTYTLLGALDRLVYIWPLTGVQLAILLPEWKHAAHRVISQLAGVLGVFVGGYIMGLPVWFALIIAAISGLEVWIAGTILQRGVRTFDDLKRRENLRLFVVATIIGPATAGMVAGIPVAFLLHQFQTDTALISALSDSLGIAIVLPTLLFALTGEYRYPSKIAPYLNKGIPAALLFTAVAFAVFWQTNSPLLFLIFPPMILLLLVMGLEGAVVTSVVLPIIACYATAHGHGPLWLNRPMEPTHRLLLLQLFLWMCIATSLPVGALLDEQRRSEMAAESARSIYQTLLKNAEDMIILSSIDGSQRYISAACQTLTGWTPEEYLALDRLATFHPDDLQMATLVIESMLQGKSEHTFRYRIAQKDGGWRWVEARVRTYMDDNTGAIAGYVGTVRDIADLLQTEEAWLLEKQTLSKLALTDPLTGLSNRSAFNEAVRERMRRLRRDSNKHALMMIDVDYFKTYNDTYGHPAGDDCLRQIAEALRSQAVRTEDVVARWGGEEFIVLLFGTNLDGSRQVAQHMLEAVRRLKIEHRSNPKQIVTISIGIADLDAASATDASLWIQRADRALYRSKQSGKDKFTVDGYEPTLVQPYPEAG